MGLGPAPEEIKLLEWGRPFGLLPSQFDSEDYRWLALADRVDEIRRLNEMYQSREGVKHLSKAAGILISGMRRRARALAKRMEESGD